MEILREEHEGNWPGITVTISMSPAVGSRSNCIGIAWWQVGRTALRLEEKQGLRNMFGGSAKFAVQCIAVESWLPMAVAKEVQYIVQGLRCVFLPPASPAFGGVAWTAALLANQEQDRPFYIKQTSGSFPCTVGQRRRNPEGTAPSLKRSVNTRCDKGVQLLMGIK